MCPKELAHESARVTAEQNEESEAMDKDIVEIDRLEVAEKLTKYQEQTRKWRGKKVVRNDMNVGDFFLKRKKNAETIGKLQVAWEGLYVVVNSVRPRAY